MNTGRVVKLVVLGDVVASKRDLLISLSNPKYPEEYNVSHEFDPQLLHYQFANNGILTPFEIQLYDSEGIEEAPDIVTILCRNASVFMLVYSITDPESFASIENKWIALISKHFPDTPFVIVATNAQKRESKEAIQSLARKGIRMVPKSKGIYTSQKLGAKSYIESEISPRINVDEAFTEAIEVGIKYKLGIPIEPAGLYAEFCKNGKDFELQALYDANNVDITRVQDSEKSPFLEAMIANNIGFGCRLIELNDGCASLANGGLDYVPLAVLEWARKGTLKELNISGNNFMNIPFELRTLKNCILDDNPLLSLPRDIRNERWPKIKRYLEALQERAITWNYRKVVLLGETGSGKSSLAKSLGAKALDGKTDKRLDLLEWKLKGTTKESAITFKIWDFGSSLVSYPTHRFFLTPSSIHIVTFNFHEYAKANLEYWFKLVKELIGNQCSILVIGTHADLIPEDEIERIIREIKMQFPKIRYPAFDGKVIAVSSKTGSNIKKVKETLVQVSMHPSMQFSAGDQSWVQLDELIRTNSLSTHYIDYQTYLNWASTCSIDSKDIDLVTEFLIKAGTTISFSNLYDDIHGESYNFFLINPMWLVNTMESLIAANNKAVTCGYATLQALEQIFPAHSLPLVFALLSKYNVLHYIKEHHCVLVPCLLPETKSVMTVNNYFPLKIPPGIQTIGRVFAFEQLPLDFLGRIMVCVLRFPGVNDLLSWKKGIMISCHEIDENGTAILQNRIYALLEFTTQLEFSIYLRYSEGLQGVAITLWRKIMQGIRVMFASHYPRLEELTNELIPCSHCMKPGTTPSKVHMFSVDECIQVMLEGKNLHMYCSNIRSPSRFVPLHTLAPDIGLVDLPHIPKSCLRNGKVLGRGAFGVVYKSTLQKLPVAVKELQISQGDSFLNKNLFIDFQVESYVMTKLKHRNVVSLYGIYVQPLSMVLELISGTDLFQFMHTEDTENKSLISISQEEFPWPLRLQIASDIANGLHYLQSLSPPIIHRDLRSPNIFLRENHSAVIGDFGMAREVYDRIGGILATWQWVAPECLDSQSALYDIRSDVYSFGVILWELAAIDMPYIELTLDPMYFHPVRKTFKLQEIKQAIITDHLRPTIPPDTPKEFSKLIQQCWDHNPSKRPTPLQIITTLQQMGARGLETNEFALPQEVARAIEPVKIPQPSSLPTPIFVHKLRESASVTTEYVCSLYYNNSLWLGVNTGAIHSLEFCLEKTEFRLKKTWQAHSKRICALLGNGDVIWSYSEDGTIKVWDTDTFALYREWEISSHTESGTMIGTSNGNVWVSSAYAGKILVFNAMKYNLVHTITNEAAVGTLHMEEHLNMVWTTSGTAGDKLALYDLRTFEFLGNIEAHKLRIAGLLSLSPLPYLCSYSLSDIRLFGGTSVSTIHCKHRTDSQTNITTAISVAGRGNIPPKLLCSSFEGFVVQYNAETLTPQQELITIDTNNNEPKGIIGLHQTNKFLITVSPKIVKIWPHIHNLNALPVLFTSVSI